MNKPKMQPILFSTPMVQAILRDMYPKTNTRRVMKPQPVMDDSGMWCWKDCQWMDGGLGFPSSGIDDHAPYKPGDTMWVRETWQHVDNGDENSGYVYKASENGQTWEENAEGWKWRPSIFMPKEAARIFLRVTEVRAERLQDITEYDAMREGFEAQLRFTKVGSGNIYNGSTTAKEEFMKYWDKLNSTRNGGIYAAEKNPWVFAYTFHRISKEEAYDAAS